jgi:hypothetical protein
MFRRITLSILALGFLVATADAAQMTPAATPTKPAAVMETTQLMTGRSAHHAHGGHMHHAHGHMHRHWHHGWHGHRHHRYFGWHHHRHCHRWHR